MYPINLSIAYQAKGIPTCNMVPAPRIGRDLFGSEPNVQPLHYTGLYVFVPTKLPRCLSKVAISTPDFALGYFFLDSF